jgi:hypothetical protein
MGSEFALMTPGGRKAPGVFCLPDVKNVFREGVLA